MRIELKGIAKEYKQGGQIVNAVNEVNFSICGGDFFSVTGRSGSGKTTLLNIVAGLTVPTAGSVLLDGQDIFAFSDKELSLYRNAKIGCIPQQSSVLSNLTVLDNVRLPFHLAKREGDSEPAARRLLAMVGIENLAKRMPKRLSGGQLKRVAIARALINKPGLLLADEPTGDLDTETTTDIMRIFKRISDEGTAVLLVTHDIDTVEFSGKRFIMDNGNLH